MSGGAAQPVHVGVAQRLVAPPLRFVRDWLARFLELQGFDRAVALAGQAFTALVPLLIVYGAITSNASGRVFADQLISVPSASAAPRPRTCARRSRLRPTSRAASAARGDLLVFSALSFTRALQRLYQLAWEQPSLGMRAAKWGLIWLVIAVVTMTMRPLVLGGLHGVVRVVLSIALAGRGVAHHAIRPARPARLVAAARARRPPDRRGHDGPWRSARRCGCRGRSRRRRPSSGRSGSPSRCLAGWSDTGSCSWWPRRAAR